MSQMSNKNKTKMNLKHNNKGLLAKKARSQEGSSLAIGIDLGTTYTCAGVWQQGRVNIIANEHFNRTTPSCVAFTKVGHLVGDAAKTQIASNLANTIYDVKRLIGREYDNPTVQYDKELWPFKVIPSSSDVRSVRKPWIVVEHQAEMKCFTAEEISSIILMKMKASAEAYLGSTVKDAVVTVPTYFDDFQRKATKDAAAIAGLNVVSIIEEPLAAAIACGFDKKLNSSSSANMIKNVLIFDLGGGTLDVSLLSKDYNCFSVKAVSGHTHLGGRDFDNNLVSHFVDEFRKRHGKDLSKSPKSLARLTASCERAKRMLTLATKATIELDAIIEGIDFSSTITRAQFEELNADLFETCMDCVGMCLMKGFVQKSDIDSIVLVGGSTRIPKVEQMLREFFTGKHLFKGINPDEAVATGAAILSGILNDNKTTVNSLLAGVVTPSSLGIEVLGGGMSIVVPQHTKVEAIRKGNYTTSYDNQTAVGFRIYEGEDVVAKRNHYLGEFRLTNVPAAPKGEPKFDVFFNINADSILTVIAQLKDTSNKKHITFEKPIKTYSKEFDIEKVTEAAKRKAENDLRMVLIKPKSCGAVLDKMLKSIGKTIKLIMA